MASIDIDDFEMKKVTVLDPVRCNRYEWPIQETISRIVANEVKHLLIDLRQVQCSPFKAAQKRKPFKTARLVIARRVSLLK